MLSVFTSTPEKKLPPLFQMAHVIQHFCKQASKHPALAKNQHSFCKDLCRSRLHKEGAVCTSQVLSETKEGAESGFEAGSCWNCHLQWIRIPKGAGFLFTLSHPLHPKIDTKIRQLLLLPTPALWVPLSLMAGPSASVCYTATLKAPPGSGLLEAGRLSRDWDTTPFMLYLIYKLRSRP